MPRPWGPATWRDLLALLPIPNLPRGLAAGAVAVAGLVVAVVVVVIALRGAPSPSAPLVLPRAQPSSQTGAATGGGGSNDDAGAVGASVGPSSSGAGRAGAGAFVHAAGAVAHPGVYRVRAGGRVSDLLDAAGGPAGDADLDQVNLAAKVSDGERVYVPRRGESPPPAAGSSTGAAGAGGVPASGPVNLNTATLEQLDSLPGVGPTTAQAILEYRKAHGRFRTVDELMEVRGIGEARLASLRPKIRV
ncbi:MAG TPA: helix-hairpin-helix domain-containing protein [Acidimicrobiales bacterium]|nr:helix-hairpin-helix domain-containing protein [Acidimicrobiales bacterium]